MSDQVLDRVEASISNVARACEKLSCQKMLYDKGDQMDFGQYMYENHEGVLLMSLLRACSGGRHDLCCKAALAILVNRPYCTTWPTCKVEYFGTRIRRRIN